MPHVISPMPCVLISQIPSAMLDGKPPNNMIVLDVNRSMDLLTLRTNTEYNAQVSAAASRLMLPQNRDGDNSALRGSITASTPSVEITSAMILRGVDFSPSRNGANNKTKAGVADVTSDPLDAVESFVPTN